MVDGPAAPTPRIVDTSIALGLLRQMILRKPLRILLMEIGEHSIVKLSFQTSIVDWRNRGRPNC